MRGSGYEVDGMRIELTAEGFKVWGLGYGDRDQNVTMRLTLVMGTNSGKGGGAICFSLTGPVNCLPLSP